MWLIPRARALLPESNEYLPSAHDSVAWMRGSCQERISAELSRVAASRASEGGEFAWEHGAPVGKYAHFSVCSVYNASVHGEPYAIAPPRPITKAQDKWARLSLCGDDNAWRCLFGRREDESAAPTCATLWDARLGDRRALAHVVLAGAIGQAILPEPFHDTPLVTVRNERSVPDGLGEYVVVHVRRGDACNFWRQEKEPYEKLFWVRFNGRRPCYPWKVYMEETERMSQLYGIKKALILSEDENAVREAREALRGRMNVMWLEYNRSSLKTEGGFIENRVHTESEVIDSALIALSLARDGCALIGHFYSHFTKAMYFLMAGRRGVAPPFVSVDGGGIIPFGLNGTVDTLMKFYI